MKISDLWHSLISYSVFLYECVEFSSEIWGWRLAESYSANPNWAVAISQDGTRIMDDAQLDLGCRIY